MDIEKLGRLCQFSMNVEPLGLVRFISLTTDLTDACLKRIKEGKQSSQDIARWLFESMARKTENSDFKDEDIIEGPSFDSQELATMPDAALEAFAEKLTQINRYLLDKAGGDSLKKSDDQTHCDFLIAAIEHYHSESRRHIDQLLKSASSSFFSESTYAQIKKNLDASSLMEQSIKRFQDRTSLLNFPESGYPKIPDITLRPLPEIRSPLLETNSILQDLNSQINDMRPLVTQGAELIRSMNDTAIRMQADYLSNATQSDRHTRRAIWIAAISLFISAIGLASSSYFSYKGLVDAQEEEKKNAALQRNLESAVERLVTAEQQSSGIVAAAIEKAGNKSVEKQK